LFYPESLINQLKLMFLEMVRHCARWICVLIVGSAVISCGKSEKEDEDPGVTANENLYVNEAYASDGEDWIEIYNKSATTKDISGYKVYDDVDNKYTLPSGTSIPANGFLILICDDGATGLHTNFKLSSGGETVYLENKAGKVVDKLVFPALIDGQSYARFPDGGTTLAITGSTTKGTSNGADGAPAISEVTRMPLVPTKAQAVTVRAELLSSAGISTMKLFYSFDGAAFTPVTMVVNAGGYEATIPAMNSLGTVEYYVEAKNATEQTSVSPYEAPDKTYKYLLNEDVLPQLVINEFLAFNSSCCPDDDSGTAEFDDWIEIYNDGDAPVDIGGYHVSDSKGNPFNSKLPKNNPSATTIPAKGFLIVWADGSGSQGDLHLDFSLSNAGEDVGLYYIDGRKIDEYTFTNQAENVSWGRTVDGGANWKAYDTPTPGTSNQ
jgi:hypothetical protein